MDTTASVTVLFCDCVGSTERLSRLGDVAGDDFRRRLFAGWRQSIRETAGTEVKTLGDGVMVVFEHSTVDALDCARRMHESAAGIDPDDPVHLKIGLSVGEVGREDGDWFGRPVVEAARLCDAAGPDQTLAPALVESLVGSRVAAHRLHRLGPMTLKGLPGALSVVEIDGPDRAGTELRGAAAGSNIVDDGKVGRRSAGRRWWLVGAAAVALVVLVVGAWVSRGGKEPGGSAPAVEAQVASKQITRPAGYKPVFKQTTCDPQTLSSTPDASCGVLVVPEARARPDGPTIELPIIKRSPQTPTGADPVIVLDANEPLSASSLPEGADTYSLQPRGFRSLRCDELATAATATLAQRADDPTAIATRVAAGQACASRLSSAGLHTDGYNMVEAANDIRDLAVALKLDRVTVAAGGLTSIVATYFARTNPGMVASLMLANPTPPGESALADPSRALARAFGKLADLCAKDPACASRYGDISERYRARFEALRDRPVPVTTKSLSGAGPFQVVLDGRRMAAALEAAMQDSAQLGLVPSAVTAASDELLGAVGINEDEVFYIGPDAYSGAFLSWGCSYDARLNRTAEISDAELAQFAGANDLSFGRLCQVWNVPSVFDQLSRPLDLDVPVLLVEGGFSVAGVNRWSESMAALLPNARVVRMETMSEDVVFAAPPCLRDLRRSFVADPTAKLDIAACERRTPPIEFNPTG